jgi:GNAT superfamily N-acetyltransferase
MPSCIAWSREVRTILAGGEQVMPHATPDVARRIGRAARLFNEAWLSAGPGVDVRRFGPVLASATPSNPELDFVNRVLGLGVAEEDLLDDVLAFYRERGVRPWLELIPEPGFERLAARLADAGGRQIGFHAILHGDPAPLPPADGVEVRRVARDEAELFAELHLAGFGVPEEHRAWGRASVPAWAEQEGWRLYVAEVDGTPAATAALIVQDGLGYLANASTDPSYRNRGCQTALVQRRIADAAAAGCDLVGSLCEFGSASQRTLERAGLTVVCTVAVWRVFH